MIVLAFMPVASILSDLPKAALAGLVVASVLPLIQVQPFVQAWRLSRPQFAVAVLTFLATLAFAPRVERACWSVWACPWRSTFGGNSTSAS